MIAYMRGKGAHFVPPEGESYRMVQRRYATWLENEILYNQDLVANEQSLRIGIVGHGAPSWYLLFDNGIHLWIVSARFPHCLQHGLRRLKREVQNAVSVRMRWLRC